MKVAVIGGNGQLGADVVEAFAKGGNAVHSLTHDNIDVCNFESVTAALMPLEPELIVNTTAMHHVESCEREPTKAFAVNGTGAKNLAVAARQLDAALMHVSTDYVFDGGKNDPYGEDDTPRPLNVYGVTKLAGEYFVRAATEKHYVIRTSALYGKHTCRGKGGLNFVELMLKLAREGREVRVVDDETVSPTFTGELARQMVALSQSRCYGLYHATAEGACSWHRFAVRIFEMAGVTARLKVARPGEFPAKAPRPKYSVLENRALKNRGLNVFAPWHEGLRQYLGATYLAAG